MRKRAFLSQSSTLCLLLTATLLSNVASVGCSRETREAKFLARGRERLAQKDYARAILEFKNAARTVPLDPEPYYQLGLVHLLLGNGMLAREGFTRATDLNPKHLQAQVKLAELLALSNEKQVLQEAEGRAQEVLKAEPDNVDALNALAAAEWKLGEKEEAEQHLQRAVSKSPHDIGSTTALAKIMLARNDFSAAEKVLVASADQTPPSVDRVVTLAEFYTWTGKLGKAEQQLRRALEIDPKNATALLDLASLLVRAGRLEEAGQTYQALSSLPDRKYKALHASFLLQTGKTEAAIAEFRKLVKEDPVDRDRRTLLVDAYLASGRTSDAEECLNSALKTNPGDVDALLQQGKIYLRAGKYQEARDDLASVIQAEPTLAEAHYLMAGVYRAFGEILARRRELAEALKLKPELLEARVELAQLLIDTRNAKAALDLMDATPDEQKETIAAIVQRNWALLALGSGDELRQGIDRGLGKARVPDLVLQQGTLKFLSGDYAGSRPLLEELLRQNPEEVRALEALARGYAAQKQDAVALRKIREYASMRPKSVGVQQFLGLWLLNNGRPVEARQVLEAAKAADPNSAVLDLALARVDLAEDKLEAARQRLSALVQRNERNDEARYLLAMLETKTGRYSEAIAHYRKLADNDEPDLVVLNNLAALLSEYGDQPDEALKYAQKAQEIAPNDAAVEDTIGWVFYRKGIYPTAVRHLENAVAKEATARRRYHLAMAYAKNGDVKRAQAILDLAVQMDPKLPESQLASRVVEEAARRTKAPVPAQR
jgi:Tfp pilus assembly protein PilF